ncbi:8-amino-7-oxononanoate synthase [Oxalobacteraceae bacterium OM1]|nr:8-amino-7-oxononanoate synthase [Oxalobacteraceae bacterium OM1]
MELLDRLERQLGELDRAGLRRRLRVVDTPCAPHATVDGREMLAFCSNDYLGLASHPRIVEAMREGASRYGAGSGASHLISGHSRAHAELEERLAAFLAPHLEAPRALYFSTGYLANLALLATLAGRDADLFCEELNHASLIDGARLSRSNVRIYPHRDIAALERLLAASTAKDKVVVTDSVFSMDGNLAPLPELLALCERHGAWLIVDDAHGFGVLGEHGRGALEHFALQSPHLVYMGTLGKAAGVAGAFVAAHTTVIEWLLQRARTYIFTTAAPPAVAHALLAALDIIDSDEGLARRQRVQLHVERLAHELQPRRWQLMPSQTAIQPVIIGGNNETMQAAANLQERGLWVPGIRPPTVPAGTARLRITLSAAHTDDDLSRLIAAFRDVETA